MGAFLRYFRDHPWQRRALTASVAIIIGGLTALLMFPYVRDQLLIRDLSGDDQDARDEAMGYLTNLAREFPDTLARLNDALDTDDDLQFRMVAAILRKLNKWDVPGRDDLQNDRLNALDLVAGQKVEKDPGGVQAFMRRSIVVDVLTCGRDNVHIRRAMAIACEDSDAGVRELGTMLAGRFGDDEILRKLLSDKDPSVAAAAALSAAVGRRKALVGAIEPLLQGSAGGGNAGDEVVSAGAYALATLDPGGSGPMLCAMLDVDLPADLRDRLLHVMTVLNTDAAKETVLRILAAARRAGRYPPAMALLAAGKLKLTEAEQDVRDVLAGNRTEDARDYGHAQAAIAAAQLLNIGVRDEIFRLCRDLWGPAEPLTLLAAIRLLGRQVADDAPHQSVSSRTNCLSLLSLAAATSTRAQNWPGRGAEKITADPLPAAAAAVELWKLDRTRRPDSIRQVTRFEKHSLPGDYVAWHVGLTGPTDEAMTLGFAMLPLTRALRTEQLKAATAPKDVGLAVERTAVRNKGEKTAGAMLLALAARTDAQKAAAVERIELRLKYETDWTTVGAYRCALLILGRQDRFQTVRTLRGAADFPRRRVITALLAAGDRDTVDWLVLNPRRPLEDVAGMLITLDLGEVLARAVATMPTIDLAARGRLQKWQARIMRHFWAVRRGGLVVELRR